METIPWKLLDQLAWSTRALTIETCVNKVKGDRTHTSVESQEQKISTPPPQTKIILRLLFVLFPFHLVSKTVLELLSVCLCTPKGLRWTVRYGDQGTTTEGDLIWRQGHFGAGYNPLWVWTGTPSHIYVKMKGGSSDDNSRDAWQTTRKQTGSTEILPQPSGADLLSPWSQTSEVT